MEKEFVPYQQALELKELGFNEECFGYFIESGEWIPSSYALGSGAYPTNSDLLPGWVSSPLLSQVFKWVREKRGIFIQPNRTVDNQGIWYYFSAATRRTDVFDGSFKYEDAELECLNGLIKLLKEKK